MNELVTMLRSPQANIIDVRTRAEFAGGHVAGSHNIPLNELPQHLDEISKLQPAVLCCASGARSAQATMFLKQNGINCVNGGGWTNVNYYKNNQA